MMMVMVGNQFLKEQIEELSIKVRHVGLIAQERPFAVWSFRLESDWTDFHTVYSVSSLHNESEGQVLS